MTAPNLWADANLTLGDPNNGPVFSITKSPTGHTMAEVGGVLTMAPGSVVVGGQVIGGSKFPKVVTANYTMQEGDGWVVVAPTAASGTVSIQLPLNPAPGSVYYVTRGQDQASPSDVAVRVVGNVAGGSGGDTIYSIPSTAGGYYIGRQNETVAFTINTQLPAFNYTDWFALGGLGLETYTASFVPNLAGTVIVPLAGFAAGNGGGDGGHPRVLYGLSIAVAPALSAGKLTLEPRFNGVALSTDVLDLTSTTQTAASRVSAGSPCAGPGVGFFTPAPGGFLFSPPAGGGVLDVAVIASGGATGPTSGILSAMVL